MAPESQFPRKPESRTLHRTCGSVQVSTAGNPQNIAGHPYMKLFGMDCNLPPGLSQKPFKQLPAQEPFRRHLECPGQYHYLEVCYLPDPGLNF